MNKAEKQDPSSSCLDLANYARQCEKCIKSAIVLYDRQMRRAHCCAKELTDRLPAALSAHEFVPYFPAQVNMITGEIVLAVRRLVRWDHPERVQPPVSLSPVFEKTAALSKSTGMLQAVCHTLEAGWTTDLPVHRCPALVPASISTIWTSPTGSLPWQTATASPMNSWAEITEHHRDAPQTGSHELPP